MAPAYITAYEAKLGMPDAIDTGVLKYDVVLKRNAEQASRLIERLCGRNFFARSKQVYIEPTASDATLWLPETMLDITEVKMSSDGGVTYETLAATDYLKYGGPGLRLNEKPYYTLMMNRNGNYANWYTGQQAVLVTGIVGYHDDYDYAWETVTPTVQDDPLTINATNITVADADIQDVWANQLFQVGQVLRLEQEQVEIIHINPVAETLQVARHVNGTTAAAHIKTTPIEIYHPPMLIQRACVVQCVRWLRRGQLSYADASASQTGQVMYTQRIDPDIVAMLLDAGYRKVTV